MKKLSFKGASWDSMFLTFVKVLTTLTSIVLTKILSVGLSLAEYGTYSQANVIISISTSILLLGLGDALNYFFNSRTQEITEEKRIKIVNTIYFLEIIAGVILASVLVLSKSIISGYFSNEMLSTIIIIISIKPMLDNLVYFYQVLYISTGKAKVIAVRNLVIAVIKMLAMYIAVIVFHDIKTIFLLLILLDIGQLVFFKFYFSRDCFLINPFKIISNYIKPILVYGLPMGVFAVTNILTRDIDKLIIGRMADTETLAIYTNCSKVLPFDIIAVSFSTVLIPYIMKYITSKQKNSALILFRNYLKVGYYSVWILGVSVLITSKQAIGFLYTDDYVIGNTIFLLYILDSMIRFASMHLILTASGKSKELMVYSLLSLLINVALNIVLYKWIGMIGPAVATLITAFVYVLLVLNKTKQILGAKWLELFDIKDTIRFLILLLATGLIVYFVNKLLLEFGVPRFVDMFLSMALFCITNLFLNLKQIKEILSNINQLKL